MASPSPAPPVPVGEDNWIDYIEQQQRDANTLEQRIRIVELYRSAVGAEPGSLRVWIAYCTYFWSLYVESSQCSASVASWSADEQAAAAEIFSLDAALHLWNEGHEATQFRLSDSHQLWNRWIALERELLDRTRTAEGVRRITHLYRNRLAIPHVAWDETSSAFSSFLSEYNPASYEDTMRAVTEHSLLAKRIVERRDGMEMALRLAERSGDDQAHKDAMTNYLDWETANALAEQPNKITAVRVALGLFSRALSGIFKTDDIIWTDFIVLIAQLSNGSAMGGTQTNPNGSHATKHHRSYSQSHSPHHNEELARFLPNSLDILQRAVQHCPWSGSLWARYIICGEQVGLSFSDIERIKHAATNSSLDRDGMAAVVEMYTAWCGYLRRSAMDPNASDEAVDLADSGLVAAVEAVQVWGQRRFGSAFQGDPNYRLEHITIQHLTEKHNAVDEAREHWEKLVAKDLHANDYTFWLSYYDWEMDVFRSQRVNSYRSPTPAAANIRSPRVPIQAVRVLSRALQNLHLNWPERIMDIYVRHCNDFQTADVLCDAFNDVHKLRKLLAKHRQEAAALQAAQAAQAVQESQETRAKSTHPYDARQFGEAEANHATPARGLVDDSPSSAKRKRETIFTDAAESSTKRVKHDNAPTPAAIQAAGGAQEQRQASLKRDRENTSVYVENLPMDTTSTKLRQYFRDYGHVNNIQLKKGENDKSAVALVEFRSVEDVQSALIRDGKYFGDFVISVKPAAGVTLFLTNFPPTADDAYFHGLFSKCGSIFGIRWPSLKFNAHRRFCYVSFRDAASAAKAVQLDGKMLDGRYKLSAKFSDPAQKKCREGAVEEGREVHVKNFGPDMDETGLEALFSKYGQVQRVRLLRNISGRCRGSGFIVYETREQAAHAVAELDKVKLGSHILSVDLSITSQYKPTARETSATPETTVQKDGEQSRGDKTEEARSHGGNPAERTFALLGIPDTVGIARVRALVEPYGHIVKLVLRADHGGAIVEYGDAASAGAAQLALTGAAIDGRQLRTGSVAQLFQEKGEMRVDRVDKPGPAASAVVATPATPATAFVPLYVKRPVLGGKGAAKRGLGFSGAVVAGGKPAKDKGDAAVNGLTAGYEVQPTKRSNADFRALFLSGQSEGKDGGKESGEKTTAEGGKTAEVAGKDANSQTRQVR